VFRPAIRPYFHRRAGSFCSFFQIDCRAAIRPHQRGLYICRKWRNDVRTAQRWKGAVPDRRTIRLRRLPSRTAAYHMLTRYGTTLLLVMSICVAGGPAVAFPARTGVLDLTNPGDYPFNNFFKDADGLGNGANWAYPAALDADGYPNRLGPSTPLPGSIPMSLGLPNDFCKYHWILDWEGSAGPNRIHYGLQLNLQGSQIPRGHVVATTGGAQVADRGPGGTLAFDLEAYGGSPGLRSSVEFAMDDCAKGGMDDTWSSQFPFQFRIGGIFNQLKDLRLYRCVPDCKTAVARVNASPYGGFNPDFITAIKDLQPGWLRMMGYQQTVIYNNLTRMAYRPPPTVLSFRTHYWKPSAWVGSIQCASHTNFGPNCDSDYYIASLPGVTSLTDGLTIQGRVEAPNNTDWPTLNLNGLGPKPIFLFGGSLIANGGTFVAGGAFTTGSRTIPVIDCSGPSGAYIYDLTRGRLLGVSSRCGTHSKTLTLEANSLANSVGINDMLAWNTNMTKATSSFSAGAVTIAVTSCNVSGGVSGNVFDVTTNTQVGMVATCNGTSLTLTVGGSLTSSAGSGDVLTFASGPFNNKTQDGLYTLFYSKYADAWLVDITGERGIISGVPIEALVDIANATQTNLWLNIPCFLTHDGSHRKFAQIVKDRLSPDLDFAVEYCNEVWNGSFPQSGYAYYSAARWLGIGVEGDDRGLRSWDGYQAKLSFDAMLAVWGNSPRFYPLIASHQFANEFTSQQRDEFEGARLCPTCGPPYANAIYRANVGEISYNTAPNRPIDEARFISVAPYFQGTQCTANYGVASTQYAGLAKAADQWLAGDSKDAFDFLYADIMGSAKTSGNTLYHIMVAPALPGTYNFSNFQGWENVARALTATTGHPVKVLQYEGAMQCMPPPLNTCMRMTGGGALAIQPFKYCGYNAPGFQLGEQLTDPRFPGFTYTISQVAPDGTPVAGTWTQPRSGPGSQTGALLIGGSGYSANGNYFQVNITVNGGDGTVSGGGKVIAVTPYSGLIQGLIYAFKKSSKFESLMTCAYTGAGSPSDPAPGCIVPGMMSYPSTAGVAQFGLAGGGLGSPWSLYLQDIYGTRFRSYEAFKKLNGG
jgi:hypothetical protein